MLPRSPCLRRRSAAGSPPAQLRNLTAHHRERCAPYARVVDAWERSRGGAVLRRARRLPLHTRDGVQGVRIEVHQRRGDAGTVVGTTTGTASTIYVDKATRHRQSCRPITSSPTLWARSADRTSYSIWKRTVRGAEAMSARGAAILSLAHLATDFHFVVVKPMAISTSTNRLCASARRDWRPAVHRLWFYPCPLSRARGSAVESPSRDPHTRTRCCCTAAAGSGSRPCRWTRRRSTGP